MSLLLNLRTYLLTLYTNLTEPNTTPNKPTNTAENLTGSRTGEPAKCRFRLDNHSSSILTLPDGRKLGYAQYGSPTGHAILYQHGLPGSRLEAATYHTLGLELNARIIATDRPGIGWSTPHPNRCLLDHPKDVERLTEHLGLERYSVLGVSGGGPYALACAATLPPSKLKCVSIVCGMGPPDIGMRGADWVHWLGFPYGFRYAPRWLGRWFWSRQPEGRLDLSEEQQVDLMLKSGARAGPDALDHDILTDADFLRLVVRSGREAFARGLDAVWEDGRVICSDFGFRVEDIRGDLEVQLWYGRYDSFVPLVHGEQIAARLGGRAQLRVEDEAHAGISIHWKREILESLIRGT